MDFSNADLTFLYFLLGGICGFWLNAIRNRMELTPDDGDYEIVIDVAADQAPIDAIYETLIDAVSMGEIRDWEFDELVIRLAKHASQEKHTL